jgi:hypothetical protein
LSSTYATALHQLQSEFRALAGTQPNEAQLLVLKLAHADAPSLISQRRRQTRERLMP